MGDRLATGRNNRSTPRANASAHTTHTNRQTDIQTDTHILPDWPDALCRLAVGTELEECGKGGREEGREGERERERGRGGGRERERGGGGRGDTQRCPL